MEVFRKHKRWREVHSVSVKMSVYCACRAIRLPVRIWAWSLWAERGGRAAVDRQQGAGADPCRRRGYKNTPVRRQPDTRPPAASVRQDARGRVKHAFAWRSQLHARRGSRHRLASARWPCCVSIFSGIRFSPSLTFAGHKSRTEKKFMPAHTYAFEKP